MNDFHEIIYKKRGLGGASRFWRGESSFFCQTKATIGLSPLIVVQTSLRHAGPGVSRVAIVTKVCGVLRCFAVSDTASSRERYGTWFVLRFKASVWGFLTKSAKFSGFFLGGTKQKIPENLANFVKKHHTDAFETQNESGAIALPERDGI